MKTHMTIRTHPTQAVTGILLLLSVASGTVQAEEVRLPGLFSDHMIMQRDRPVPVWGTAKPGEMVTVTIANQRKSAQADKAGAWRLTLDPMPVGTGLVLTVTGENTIELQDVAVGDVYLCGGQSNMTHGVAGEDVQTADFPDIRLFEVPRTPASSPQRGFGPDIVDGHPALWRECSPKNLQNFSGVAYYFGRELHRQLGIPIGLIVAAYGGTSAQLWMSRDALLKRDDLRDQVLEQERDYPELLKGTLPERMKVWWDANDPGTRQRWNAPDYDDAAWRTIAAPGSWVKTEIGDFLGIVWFRRQVEIPAAWAGKDLVLHLGGIGNRDVAFFDGQEVGDREMFLWYLARNYKVPAAQVKAGKATIAIGVCGDGDDKLGLMGPSDDMRIELAGDATQRIPLSGTWKYQKGPAIKSLPTVPRYVWGRVGDPGRHCFLYNGMIAPVAPYAVRGAIFYQGESNAADPAQYATLFPDLIRDWRSAWKAKADGSDFGFYFVQLANYECQEDWAGLRWAQTQALKLPKTGMAVAVDIGDGGNIHPGNKVDVGKRLALIALAKEYGRNIEFSGPVFAAMRIAGSTMRIEFTHADGLRTRDGQAAKGFTLQGADGAWHPATATITGSAIVVSCDAVPAPKAVRYAWASNPQVNLCNSADLPAVPFRSDDGP